jgi:hypothetical protein
LTPPGADSKIAVCGWEGWTSLLWGQFQEAKQTGVLRAKAFHLDPESAKLHVQRRPSLWTV